MGNSSNLKYNQDCQIIGNDNDWKLNPSFDVECARYIGLMECNACSTRPLDKGMPVQIVHN